MGSRYSEVLLNPDGTLHAQHVPTSLKTENLAAAFISSQGNPVTHAPGLGLYFPEAEGALGNFSHDDTAAVQAAVNAAALTTGTVLLRPGGRYTVSQIRMKTGVTLRGGGTQYTRIFQKAATSGHCVVLDDATVTDVTICDLAINGSKASQSVANAGIYLDHTGGDTSILPRHRISHVHVRSTLGDGVYLGTLTRNMQVDNLTVYGADGYGLHLAGADSQLSNIDVASSGLDGILIDGGAYILTGSKSWTSGRIDGVGSGYRIASAGNTINGAHAQENQGRGFYAFKSGTQIVGLTMTGILSDSNNASGTGYVEIDLFNVQNAVITGSTKKAAGVGGTAVSGLQINGGSLGNDITLAITGQSSWAVTSGSETAGNTLRINGRDDRVFALTYASTVTLNPWNAETNTVTLTGDVNFANPGVKPAGLRQRIIMTQDATGGRIATFGTDFQVLGWTPNRSPNAVNIVEFLCNGTKWVQVGAANTESVFYKTVDQSVTSSTTLVTDADLVFTAAIGEIWELNGVLFVEGGTTGDFKVSVTGQGSPVGYWECLGPNASASSTSFTSILSLAAAYNLNQVVGMLGAGSVIPVQIRGLMTVGTTGLVNIKWAQSATDSVATIVHAGSFLRARRIA